MKGDQCRKSIGRCGTDAEAAWHKHHPEANESHVNSRGRQHDLQYDRTRRYLEHMTYPIALSLTSWRRPSLRAAR
jgi:hypothetical protein